MIVCRAEFKDLRKELDSASKAKPSPSARAGIGSNDLLFYIYTSGTTGMPKAARIKHQRFFLAGVSFSHMFSVRADDRIYCPLPIYHSAAGMLGVSMAWHMGCTLVLRSACYLFVGCC